MPRCQTRLLYVFLFLFNTLAPLSLQAQNDNTTMLGHWARGPAEAVAIQGDLAYFAVGGVFSIADVTDPAHPQLLAESPVSSVIFAIAVEGALAYVQTPGQGLVIFDVSDPSAPFPISKTTIDGFGYSIAVQSGFAYIANGLGLRILDISDPVAPVQIAALNTPNIAYQVTLDGHYAYISEFGTGLRIYDISNPEATVQVGLFQPLGTGLTQATVVKDGLAYCADWFGMRVLDVSNPSAPVQIGLYPPSGSFFYDLALIGTTVFVSDGLGLVAINVSNPYQPSLAGHLGGSHVGDFYYTVVAKENIVYLADSVEGLRIIDAQNPAAMVQKAKLDARGFSYDNQIVGDLAFVANGNRGLRILDVSNPATPVEIGFSETAEASFALDVQGDWVYLAEAQGGLRVVDASDPANPQETDNLPFADWVYDVGAQGQRAYLANGNNGIAIVDVSDPYNLVFLGSYDNNDFCHGHDSRPFVQGLAVANGLVYAAEKDCGLRILDLSNPDSPQSLSSLDIPGTTINVVVNGDLAFISAGTEGLRIVDVANPYNPIVVGMYPGLGFVEDVAVEGDYAYLTQDRDGVEVVDVSNPFTPVYAGHFQTGYDARGISVSQNSINISDGLDGLYMIRNELLAASATPEDDLPFSTLFQLGNQPNPFNPATMINYILPKEGPVKLVVFDMRGREIAKLVDTVQSAGPHSIQFDGRRVASGVYFYRLEAQSQSSTKKMIVVN